MNVLDLTTGLWLCKRVSLFTGDPCLGIHGDTSIWSPTHSQVGQPELKKKKKSVLSFISQLSRNHKLGKSFNLAEGEAGLCFITPVTGGSEIFKINH